MAASIREFGFRQPIVVDEQGIIVVGHTRYQLLDAWFGNVARVLLPGHGFFVWGGYANLGNYPPFLKKHGLYFSQGIVWDKEHPVLTRKDFMGACEIAFYGWREVPHTVTLGRTTPANSFGEAATAAVIRAFLLLTPNQISILAMNTVNGAKRRKQRELLGTPSTTLAYVPLRWQFG